MNNFSNGVGQHIGEPNEMNDTWKVFKIMSEFVEGYHFLNQLDKEITVLGSARFKEHEKFYKMAQEFGELASIDGYTVLTGGGPGVMEAANRGAFSKDGNSVAVNIQLPFEQKLNPYVKKAVSMSYFFTRKVILTSPAHCFVYFPGGYGTMDEFFEVVDHMAIGKMCHIPIILVGREYWQPLIHILQDDVCALSPHLRDELSNLYVVDSASEAMTIVQKHANMTLEERRSCELAPLSFHGGMQNVDWKIFRIMAELVEGLEFISKMKKTLTVLGTKGIDETSEYYDAARQVGYEFGALGYSIVTGAYEGTAEAANRGAKDAGAQSVGMALEIRGNSHINKYVSKSIVFKFPFTRKVVVTAPSNGFVFFPGGFGTLHQLFEVLTLIQTGKMPKIPVILYGSRYWSKFDGYIKQILVEKFNTISHGDERLYHIVDSLEEVKKHIT